MRNYRPLLLQSLEIHIPGLRLHRLRLHRHLPQADALADHKHAFGQVLCYVSGRGAIRVNGKLIEVGPGSVVHLPPGMVHGFKEPAGRRPLTLALDFSVRGSKHLAFEIGSFAGDRLTLLKGELSELVRLHTSEDSPDRILIAGKSLAILDMCLRTLGWFGPAARPMSPHVRAIDRVLAKPDALETDLATLADQSGFDRDYLSRKIKEATGLTLRERRDSLRLNKARRLLRDGKPVRDVAGAVGLSDQNYFARWFKKHTGVQPSRFK
jgi:AraC-like DNA-binding protein